MVAKLRDILMQIGHRVEELENEGADRDLINAWSRAFGAVFKECKHDVTKQERIQRNMDCYAFDLKERQATVAFVRARNTPDCVAFADQMNAELGKHALEDLYAYFDAKGELQWDGQENFWHLPAGHSFTTWMAEKTPEGKRAKAELERAISSQYEESQPSYERLLVDPEPALHEQHERLA